MNYVKSFDLFGVPAAQIPAIPGSGAPTTTTEGAVGCLYMDTDTGNLYKCTAVADGVYTWVEAGGVDMDEVMEYLRDNLTAADVGAIPSEGRSVTNDNIAFGAITSGLLANKAVTKDKIADDVLEQMSAGGLDLEQLTIGVTGVDGGNELSLSDGTTTKTAVIPAVSADADDIQVAVNAYLNEHPVKDGEDGENGADGKDGADGVTPHIGDNGNWWIGDTDTGVIAQGKDGVDGENGKDGTATDEQVNTAVSAWLDEHPEATTTVADGAVTPTKTSFWGSEKPYIIGDNYPCQPVEVLPYRGVRTLGSKGWFLYLCDVRADTDNVKVFSVKAGTMYTIIPANSAHAYYGTEYTITDPTEAELQNWSNNSTYTGNNVLEKMINLSESVGLVNTQNYAASSLFRYTPPKDGYIFMPSVADGAMLFEGASPFKIYENFLDKVYAGEITNFNHILYGYSAYVEKYSEFAKGKLRVETSDEFKRLLRTGEYWDDLHNSTIKLFVMGDSITWAASNIGADKAYRTLLSNKYNIEHYNAAQNNTTITADLGDAWKVGPTTYSKGVDGLIEAHLAESQMETENDERYTNFMHCVNDYPIFTIAFGTNDFRYNAPIGTIDDTDSSTFMGGYKKLIVRIRELYPNSSIILLTPWKQENWNTANSAGHVLADYNLAIHEIASKTRKCFVLDMFNNPYINERSNSRNGVYADNVHLGKYGHILIAEELEKLILKCVVLNGYPYVKTNLADSWTGL